jgi:SpoVK/Ycf46/Vps4 family AAA+-type ATPase
VLALSSGGAEHSKADCINGLVYVLRRDLYRIDLATVVSKYIGETEKNLRRLFDEAERSGAILFFDEADALFGKRSEVNESHDRYANIEVGQLIDRLEEFAGIAVLASNSRSVIRDIEARGNVVLRLPPGKKRD